jgi:hypothetical protein
MVGGEKKVILRWKSHLAVGSEGTVAVFGAGAAIVAYYIFRILT